MNFNIEDLQKLRDQCNMILSNVSEKEKMDNIISQYHNYSIWEANDGYWRTYIMIDGKRKLIKKKSKDKLIEHLENHYKKLKPHNIEDIFPLWVEYKKALGVSNSTVIKYENSYERFFKGKELTTKDMWNITEVDVGNFIRNILDNGKYSFKCIKQLYQLLNNLFEYSIRKKIIFENPCEYVKIKMFQKYCTENYKMPEERILSENELVKLWNKLEDDHINKPSLISSYAVQLAILTGLRS